MRLAALTEGLAHTLLQGTEEKDVNALIYFSEEAVPGSMFFAIPGAEEDGLAYAGRAVERGAETVVLQSLSTRQNSLSPLFLPSGVTLILVEDVRKALAHVSCLFYGSPCEHMMTAAVTGTKGKTSTAFMLRAIFEEAGLKTGLLGTVQNGWQNHFEEAERTTPQSLDIQSWCRKMADDGCQAMVMEVSSQGLKQSRADGIRFDLAIFTNLSPDHIGPGEHETFEEYAWWKSQLFGRCDTAVINEDDAQWRHLLAERNREPDFRVPRVISFGRSESADYRCETLELIRTEAGPGVAFQMEGQRIVLQLPGRFNGMNAAGAAAAARRMGIGWPAIRRALETLKIPGRVEPVDTGGHTSVLVDYAHNGISLEQILTDLRQYEPARLIAVFGCGGNRDRNRRFEMGRAAARLADLTVVTSDNPRKEKPEDIIRDITDAMDAAGAEEGSYVVIPDRTEAVRWAVREGNSNDIVLIAGKGHETYQLAGDKKIHLDDRETVRNTGYDTIDNEIMGETET